MKAEIFGVRIFVSYPAVAFLCIALICDKRGTLLFCVIASVFHEFGHLIAMKHNGVPFRSISVNLGDVAISADCRNISRRADFSITFAGVAVNFCFSLVSALLYWLFNVNMFLHFALSNLCIGVFNLLPVRFLDGGQLILLLLQKYFSYKTCTAVLNVLTVLFLIPVAVAGFIFLFNSSYNYSLLFAALYLICTLVSKEIR